MKMDMSTDFTLPFTELFCECYEEFITMLGENDLNKNLQSDISPTEFLRIHRPYLSTIESNDIKVLTDLPYLNRRRLLAIIHKNVSDGSVIMTFLSNLVLYATISVTPPSKLSDSTRILAYNIIQRRATAPPKEELSDILGEMMGTCKELLSDKSNKSVSYIQQQSNGSDAPDPTKIIQTIIRSMDSSHTPASEEERDFNKSIKCMFDQFGDRLSNQKLDINEAMKAIGSFARKQPVPQTQFQEAMSAVSSMVPSQP